MVSVPVWFVLCSDFNSIAVVSSCPQKLRTSDHLFNSGDAEGGRSRGPSLGYWLVCELLLQKTSCQRKNFNEAI